MSSLVHISCRLIALLFVAANRLADWLNPLNRAGISSFVYWTWRFSMKSFAHQFDNNWIFATRRLTLNDIDSIELRNSIPRTSSHLNELRGAGAFRQILQQTTKRLLSQMFPHQRDLPGISSIPLSSPAVRSCHGAHSRRPDQYSSLSAEEKLRRVERACCWRTRVKY